MVGFKNSYRSGDDAKEPEGYEPLPPGLYRAWLDKEPEYKLAKSGKSHHLECVWEIDTESGTRQVWDYITLEHKTSKKAVAFGEYKMQELSLIHI